MDYKIRNYININTKQLNQIYDNKKRRRSVRERLYT